MFSLSLSLGLTKNGESSALDELALQRQPSSGERGSRLPRADKGSYYYNVMGSSYVSSEAGRKEKLGFSPAAAPEEETRAFMEERSLLKRSEEPLHAAGLRDPLMGAVSVLPLAGILAINLGRADGFQVLQGSIAPPPLFCAQQEAFPRLIVWQERRCCSWRGISHRLPEDLSAVPVT